MRIHLLAAGLLAFTLALRADFSYQETTQMTGGLVYNLLKLGGPFTRSAREPQTSTVYVQGNRMATHYKESATVIDLDQETITEIDLKKKQYSVTTFEQMRAAMEKALAEARKQKKGEKQPNVDVKFRVNAKATGKTKAVGGVNTRQLRISMEMEATDRDSGAGGAMSILNDAWMGPAAGYDEVKAFEIKLGEKLGAVFRRGMEQMMLTQPEMVQGLAAAAKETAKVDGVPLESVTRVGGSLQDLIAAADAPPKPEEPKQSNTEKIAGIAGRLGGFGGRRDRDEEKPKQNEPGSGMLIEMTATLSGFSTAAVDPAKFAVPAGFKQVPSEFAKKAK
jgi:hypothetical protein